MICNLGVVGSNPTRGSKRTKQKVEISTFCFVFIYAPARVYLEGLTIESCDYRELYEKYKDEPNVVFIVDPPYLSTEVGTYKMYWHLSDYLDVLNVLKGKPFVYFTSDKSSIIELCEWLGKNKTLGNPFEGCKRFEFNAHVNFDAGYKDMMLVKSNAA